MTDLKKEIEKRIEIAKKISSENNPEIKAMERKMTDLKKEIEIDEKFMKNYIDTYANLIRVFSIMNSKEFLKFKQKLEVKNENI
jgi:DNA-binding transcriptional regulator GbsR (MarR family)